jgi:hypothetical protein
VLKSFASSLLRHVIRPASTTYGFHALVWMQDSDAEMMLCNLLDADVTLCLTRQMAVMTLPSGSKGEQDEAAAIAADHPKEAYGAAWIEDMSFNTLRMLHKLRGVEYLRERALATATDGSAAAAGHMWVLRVRPDIELHSRLPLPPPPHPRKLAADDTHEGGGGGDGELTPAVSATAFDAAARQRHSNVLMPWLCHAEALCSDQWMLLSPAASARLATLYEPSVLRKTMSLSSPPSLYPERLVWKLLTTAYTVTPLPSAPEHHLLAADGIERDAYAKLKRDFPSCFR